IHPKILLIKENYEAYIANLGLSKLLNEKETRKTLTKHQDHDTKTSKSEQQAYTNE
ncbi:351_t:CDS:2, partial [Gigaspora margarita]